MGLGILRKGGVCEVGGWVVGGLLVFFGGDMSWRILW